MTLLSPIYVPADEWTLPDGFAAHDGGTCPVEPRTFVECLIRTDLGIGSSGIVRAEHIGSWTHDQPGGLGEIVASREA